VNYRVEKDSLGELKIPAEALYGIQTFRAIQNFPVTAQPPHKEFIRAYGVVKRCAAQANLKAGRLPQRIADFIIQASTEIIAGRHYEHFVIDRLANITSFNMNVNEVIANRALELSGNPIGSYHIIHPNDHVNMSQSTNDTFPTAMSIAIIMLWPTMESSIGQLRDAFLEKGKEFVDIVKSGRTHLQDAVPTTLGIEFKAYGKALQQGVHDLEEAIETLRVVPIGGTAVGTGINSYPSYISDFLGYAREEGYQLKSSDSIPLVQHSRGNIGKFSGAMRALSLELIRISNDLRLLSSGPTSGIGELELPPVQPGSSIMPGKVNPVMAESLNMLAFRVVGNDAAVGLAVQAGQLELNVMMPLMIDAILDSMQMIIRFLPIFASKCINGIKPNLHYIERNLENNPMIASILTPMLGYDKASEIVKEAIEMNKSIKSILLEKKLFTETDIKRIFSSKALLSANPADTPKRSKQMRT
jgi:aspartate ammonia-lyase